MPPAIPTLDTPLAAILAALAVLLPFAAAAVLPALPSPHLAARVGRGAALAGFALLCLLAGTGGWPASGGLLLADAPALLLALTAGLLGVLAAWTVPAGTTRRRDRAIPPALLGATLLATLAGSPGMSWVGLEAAAALLALATALPGGAAALRAAGGCLFRCGGGLALALFGVVALALAAPGAAGWDGLLHTVGPAPGLQGAALSLATACLLVGVAAAAGLAPLQAWSVEAQAVSPAMALMAGPVGNAALLALLRLRAVIEAGRLRGMDAIAPGPPILAFGLVSVLLAAVGLWRARDARRLLALSGVGGRGLATCAIGLGLPGAPEAAMLQLALLALLQAAAGLCLDRRWPRLAGLALLALAGLPPLGLFVPEFMIVTGIAREAPWLLLPLGLGLGAGSWALLARGPGLFRDAAPDLAEGAGPAPHRGRSLWMPFGPRQEAG